MRIPSVIRKTLGGLTPRYYFRQLFFALLLAVFVFLASIHGGRSLSVERLIFIVISTLLYPYSRFVYERIVGFIIGESVFVVNAMAMLLAKLLTMMLCWMFALFLAPVGLAYLYYHHRKAGR